MPFLKFILNVIERKIVINPGSKKMTSRGRLQLVSCFTLSITLVLLILALSSYEAAASSSSSSAESITSISEARRSMISWTWPPIPKDWIKKSLAFLNKIRHRIIDEMLKIIGLPPTGDILHYFWTAVKWLSGKLYFFISDPRARIDTVVNWIVDSVMNPFRTLTDGMKSFQRLFRYLHKLKKGTYASFGRDNPVYKCYLEFFPGCVKDPGDTVGVIVVNYFGCAWLFYERCQLRYWWENGKWKVPRINGGDPCKILPKKKCADDPPI